MIEYLLRDFLEVDEKYLGGGVSILGDTQCSSFSENIMSKVQWGYKYLQQNSKCAHAIFWEYIYIYILSWVIYSFTSNYPSGLKYFKMAMAKIKHLLMAKMYLDWAWSGIPGMGAREGWVRCLKHNFLVHKRLDRRVWGLHQEAEGALIRTVKRRIVAWFG